MNREQERRLEELGDAFKHAVSDVINMDDPQPFEAAPTSEYRYHTEVQPVRSMNDNLSQHEVLIRQVHNGFVVNVGCQSFVFESFDTLSKYMKMYFENPNDITEKHTKGELFK
jgi:hypothetical protein